MTKDFGVNAGLVSELVGMYLHDKNSVDAQWRVYIESLLKGDVVEGRHEVSGAASRELLETATRQAGVTSLVSAYRARGHLLAQVDPLGLLAHEAPPALTDFALATFGLSESDLDKTFPSYDLPGPQSATLREIVERLRATYCRSIGVEFRDIEEPEQRAWLQERMESSGNRLVRRPELERRTLQSLTDAEQFETFVHKNFLGAKRFSLQGGESLIPMLDEMIEHVGAHGGEECVVGMAHRGRLNVLVNIMNKPAEELFAAFADQQPEKHMHSGDVKYHLGASTDRLTRSGRSVHCTLAFNPSHLEWVNPVVEGRVRAKQDRRGDKTRQSTVPMLIHGDAAFIGQGVNAETLNLANLEGYATGGTIHIIVNNQVGFTTIPRDSRSTRYATDLARMLRVPVFHVNGEDLEAVTIVAQLAVEYRQKFGADVLIDMYCYRKYGHNEGDEPRFTQPVMYAAIDKKPSVRALYATELVARGRLTQGDVDLMAQKSYQRFGESLETAKTTEVSWIPHAMGGFWQGFKGGRDQDTPEVSTQLSTEKLIALGRKLVEVPAGFLPHPKVIDALNARLHALEKGTAFNWETGESLAFASVLAEGTPIRLSGQDARRSTFTHRHAVLSNVKTGARWTPHAGIGARFEVFDSPLSEAGVLGFEYGYSLDYPDALVIWEAQFGDFANTAQVIIDQFISSCESKWRRLSGVVLLLPHGYEGQGPEHSSARLERFLQLCAEDNLQVCNLTTPAQLFHVLRRQVLRPWRKPLVIMTPKSLLRHKSAVSTIKDLATGGFQRVIPDAVVAPETARKLLICSGKVYYDLVDERAKRNIQDVAIVRLEQLYPLEGSLDPVLTQYRDGISVRWVQEEPWNAGACFFIQAHLGERLRKRFDFSCVTRDASASPATGSKASHDLEQKKLIAAAFDS